MGAAANPMERLQPALLDRLADDGRRHDVLRRKGRTGSPEGEPSAPGDHDVDSGRVLNKAQLREAVLRDLAWLLNAVQPMSSEAVSNHPAVAQSVLNFGLPALSGLQASRIDVPWLERTLRQAILRFEPRIIADTLVVRALETSSVLDTHNIIEFEIRGELWAQPVPLELLLRTQLDLEAGQVVIRDTAAAPLRTFR